MASEKEHRLTEAKIEIAARDVSAAEEVLLECEDARWSILEDSIAQRAWIMGIFDSEDQARSEWTKLVLRLAFAVTPIAIRSLDQKDWRDSYKTHFRAWRFGRLHWVPVWEREKYSVPEGDAVLWLDPGLAFGTGNHETTRLCVERLVEHAAHTGARGRVVDAGCGSGILALSAAKLGYPCVEGFDNDAEAVRVSLENSELNGLSDTVRFTVADLTDGFPSGQSDVVLANILANVLTEFAVPISRSVKPGGWLILSGILSGECELVRSAFSTVVPAWEQRSRTLGEWSDILLIRPTDELR